MAKTLVDYDIIGTFSNTKKKLADTITTCQAQAAFIDDLINFFEANNLKVVQEVDAKEKKEDK